MIHEKSCVVVTYLEQEVPQVEEAHRFEVTQSPLFRQIFKFEESGNSHRRPRKQRPGISPFWDPVYCATKVWKYDLLRPLFFKQNFQSLRSTCYILQMISRYFIRLKYCNLIRTVLLRWQLDYLTYLIFEAASQKNVSNDVRSWGTSSRTMATKSTPRNISSKCYLSWRAKYGELHPADNWFIFNGKKITLSCKKM